MIFYIEINNEIVAADTDLEKLKRTRQISKELAGCEIKQTDRPIAGFEFADTPEYLKRLRLKEICENIAQIENEYAAYLDSVVPYANGKTYRIRYAEESYQPLISAETSLLLIKSQLAPEEAAQIPSTFPLMIWDSTKLEENAVTMTFAELTNLALFLSNLQKSAWNSRKERIAVLEAEKAVILNEGTQK